MHTEEVTSVCNLIHSRSFVSNPFSRVSMVKVTSLPFSRVWPDSHAHFIRSHSRMGTLRMRLVSRMRELITVDFSCVGKFREGSLVPRQY